GRGRDGNDRCSIAARPTSSVPCGAGARAPTFGRLSGGERGAIDGADGAVDLRSRDRSTGGSGPPADALRRADRSVGGL
ncbi:MAG: hypothetical protein AVDCRST_MAG19-1148, partial [uncultured Thermomicrobiales bacterium]